MTDEFDAQMDDPLMPKKAGATGDDPVEPGEETVVDPDALLADADLDLDDNEDYE